MTTNWIDAVLNKEQSISPELLQKENLDVTGGDGFTALHVAAANGDEKSVIALLKAGANRDLKDKYDTTPTYLACSHDHARVLKILLEHGAKIEMIDCGKAIGIHEFLGTRRINNEAVDFSRKVAALSDLLKGLARDGNLDGIVAELNEDGNADILEAALNAKDADGKDVFTYADIKPDIMSAIMNKTAGAGQYQTGSHTSPASSPASERSSAEAEASAGGAKSAPATPSSRRGSFSRFGRRGSGATGAGGDDMAAGADPEFPRGSRGRASSLSPGGSRRASISGAVAGAIGRVTGRINRRPSRGSSESLLGSEDVAGRANPEEAGGGVDIPGRDAAARRGNPGSAPGRPKSGKGGLQGGGNLSYSV